MTPISGNKKVLHTYYLVGYHCLYLVRLWSKTDRIQHYIHYCTSVKVLKCVCCMELRKAGHMDFNVIIDITIKYVYSVIFMTCQTVNTTL